MSVAFFVNIQSGVLTGVGCLHNSPNRGWALLGGTSSAFRAYLAPSATTLKLANSSSEPTQIKQWALLSMRFSPSTFLDATVNTALGAINTTSIPATSYDNGLDVVIGNRGDGGSPMIGYLGPIMIYNRAITDSELTQIFDAFKARYGL